MTSVAMAPSLNTARQRNTVIVMTVLFAFVNGLQMYCTVPAFNSLSKEFSLSLTQIGLLVSLFFFGYAVGHIPAGFAAAAYGLKKVALAGSGVLAGSSIIFALSQDYILLLASRAIGGVGASLIVASIFPLAAAWARPNQTRMVVGGLVNGLGFTVGAAFGLYIWTFLIITSGWRISIIVAAMFAILVTLAGAFLIRAPYNMGELNGGHFSWKSTLSCLKSRPMWAIGIGSVGAYGALFTVSSLGPGYAETELGFGPEIAGLLGVTMLLIGIPGALIAGGIADRTKRFLPSLWVPSGLLVLLLVLLPTAGSTSIWFVLTGIGLLGMMYFSPCAVAPGEYLDEIPRQDYATALGLVLTLGNVGAMIYPTVYAVGADLAGPGFGWWLLAGISAITWFAFHLAREPRLPNREKENA